MGQVAEKNNTAKDKNASRWFGPNNESKTLFFQPRLTVGPADDAYEREADAVADKVMCMDNHDQIQTKISSIVVQPKCATCEEEENLQRKEDGTSAGHEVPSLVSDVLASGGSPMDDSSRSFMENRFGYDFSKVKIHTDQAAARSAQSINALAYTSGNSIVFNEGEFSPHTGSGKKLLAHELTHVIQQNKAIQKQIQRTFCTPYATPAEATNAEWWLRNTYMRAEGIETFGTEVYNLYDSYLNRRPGDSLAPRVFNSSSSYIHNCFQDDGYIKDDMVA